MKYIRSSLFSELFLVSIILFSCSHPEASKPIEYSGPLREGEDIEVFSTEKDQVKSKMKAKKVLEFQNGDLEFPDGIFVESYDEFGKLTSTLKANTAFYFKGEKKFRGRGKVEVTNLEKQEQLTTEELFWKPDIKKIFTDKFVTIKEPNRLITGTGLEAAQDMSYYSIANITADLDID
jgi:LPS export ABC transporter protein LptC